MPTPTYTPIPELSREAVVIDLRSGNPERMVTALLSIAFYERDRRFAQAQCEAWVVNEDENVRGIAVLSLGHIARFHGNIAFDHALPIVIRAMRDPSSFVRDNAEDALQTILATHTRRGYTREIAITQLKSDRVDTMLLALAAIPQSDLDRHFAQETLLEYLRHPNEIIKGQAVLGLAAIQWGGSQDEDLQRVMPVLSELAKLNDYVGRCAKSTLDCIETFLQSPEDGDSVGYL